MAYSPALVIRFWNRGAQALLGYSPEEAIGKHVSLVVPAERLPLLPDFTRRILRGIVIPQYETTALHKEGGRSPRFGHRVSCNKQSR